MAVPLLQTLSRIARAAWPIIQRGVREGLSANKIGAVLRTQGLGIRRQTLLQITGAERKIWTHGLSLRFLPFSATPNLRKLPVALSKIRRQYSFVVSLTGRSRLTGLPMVQNVTVSTDVGMSRQAIEAVGEEMGIAGKERYDLVLEKVLLISGLRAGAPGLI